jgi:hypothetical protein
MRLNGKRWVFIYFVFPNRNRMGKMPPNFLGANGIRKMFTGKLFENAWVNRWTGIAMGQSNCLFCWMEMGNHSLIRDWGILCR